MDLEMYDEAVRDYELANKMDRGNQEVRQLLQQAKLELKKSKRKDYYKMLGISKDANEDEIKKAYRKRALVHHPGNKINKCYRNSCRVSVPFEPRIYWASSNIS